MKTVFIDLEFCMIDRQYEKERSLSQFEVIEIGAVKLDENNHIVERFDAFVKPQYGTITPYITELTHIEGKDLENAGAFCEVMDSFLRWVGEEEVIIYSWSNSDRQQFQRECKLKKYRNTILDRLYHNWIDYQLAYGMILGIKQQISLTNAVSLAGMGFEGRAHSAITDAENTALLYVNTQNRKQGQKLLA